ncbi:uncharacterized protein LOC105219233 [Zeugodacus cucurbitae]|uniref:uncharacterized protein LOC105219233 n=1 Tax=Zeugodacus cucurbitae TaxID=28588 RepID=UPI0023D8ED39|nr:uncharacterized protein LOC105219233 [Zeugodacus cucurbitae]
MANNEIKFKSFKWSKDTTALLIALIRQNYKQLQCGVKKITFQQIAQEINNQFETNLAYDQVESKWKGLKKTYLKMKGSKTKLSWEFYEQIDEILKAEIYSSLTANCDNAFTTGFETKFDFVEYTIEPKSSTFRQSRKRRRDHSDEDHSEQEIYSSAEDVSGGTHKSQISKGPVFRKEDSDERGVRRSKVIDTDRYSKACRSRPISEDERNDYECSGCKRNHNCYESIEDARERRHQEKMKMARKFLEIFERMVDKM